MQILITLVCVILALACDNENTKEITSNTGDVEMFVPVSDAVVTEEDLSMERPDFEPMADLGSQIETETDIGVQNAGMCTLNSRMGEPCRADCDCSERHPFTTPRGTFSKEIEQVCMLEATYGLPGGHCTIQDCHTDVRSDPCAEFGYTCIVIGSLQSGITVSACHKPCVEHSDCPSTRICQPFRDMAFCWPACGNDRPCGDGFSCTEEGMCVEGNSCVPTTCDALGVTCGIVDDGCGRPLNCGPQCPLDGCTDWANWSCVDRSPNLCSCSCPAWPYAGVAPRIECTLIGTGQVGCSCSTGGEQPESNSRSLEAGGATCDQVEQMFHEAFCGLVP